MLVRKIALLERTRSAEAMPPMPRSPIQTATAGCSRKLPSACLATRRPARAASHPRSRTCCGSQQPNSDVGPVEAARRGGYSSRCRPGPGDRRQGAFSEASHAFLAGNAALEDFGSLHDLFENHATSQGAQASQARDRDYRQRDGAQQPSVRRPRRLSHGAKAPRSASVIGKGSVFYHSTFACSGETFAG
jgi:hypothetical protein